MTTTHTPGPWRYVDDSTKATLDMGLHDFSIETADGNYAIADLVHSDANARLIAAAPELLECAKRFLATIDYQIKRAENEGDTEEATLKAFMRRLVVTVIDKATEESL